MEKNAVPNPMSIAVASQILWLTGHDVSIAVASQTLWFTGHDVSIDVASQTLWLTGNVFFIFKLVIDLKS